MSAYVLMFVHVVDLGRDRAQEAFRLREVARYAREPGLHGLGRLVQAAGTWYVLVAVALLAMCGLARRSGARHRVRVVASVVTAVVMVVGAGKLVIRHPAVAHALGRPIGSFPSGHTADVTAIVGVLLVVLVPIRFRLVPYALSAGLGLAVASSRVITGAHTPDDVVAGWLVGWLLVLLAGAYLAAESERAPAAGLQGEAEQGVDQPAQLGRG